jgi:hypothetical protein
MSLEVSAKVLLVQHGDAPNGKTPAGGHRLASVLEDQSARSILEQGAHQQVIAFSLMGTEVNHDINFALGDVRLTMLEDSPLACV